MESKRKKELRDDEGAGRLLRLIRAKRDASKSQLQPNSTQHSTPKRRHDPAFREKEGQGHAGATDRAHTGCIDLS